jgi:hypothetical protein
MDHATASPEGASAPLGRTALGETLHRDLAELAACGDRRPGREVHRAVRELLARRLQGDGASVYAGTDLVAPYGAGLANLLALVPGAHRDRRRLLLATHYDAATPTDADVAAMAVVLAAVPLLHRAGLERGVIVAFLDDGAPPRYRDTETGASILLSEQLRNELKAAVVLDRVGGLPEAPLAAGSVFVSGAESDARFPPLLEQVARGVLLAPIHRRYRSGVAAADAFRDARVPYLELFGPRRGRPAQPITHDVGALAELAGLVVRLLVQLDLARLPGPFEGYDSSPFEAEALRRALVSHDEAGAADAAGSARQQVDAAVLRLGALVAP